MPGCTFQKRWLLTEDYKHWIQEIKSVHYAHCKLCRKDIDLRGMGESALKSHMRGKKHQEFSKSERSKLSCLSQFFVKKDSDLSSAGVLKLFCVAYHLKF